jgi:hypothetical protein
MAFQRELSVIVGLFGLLFLVLVYRAFVVIQPCRHNITPLNESAKIKVTDEQIKRLQASLRFETVSFGKGHQNESEIHKYVEFIRKGLIFDS